MKKLTCEIAENAEFKVIKSETVNNVFNKRDGFNATWGRTKEEDPPYIPFGPLLLDMEISTICHRGCPFCYKSNTGAGKNMTLEEFKVLFHKLPRTLTQIAFGIGDLHDLDAEMWKIFRYCRENEYQMIVPNVTINGRLLTDEKAHQLKNLMGAVAVSHYDDDECFDAVHKLTDIGMKQVNIHKLVSSETFDSCMDLMKKIKGDKRLAKLNAVVFLMLKNKGRGEGFHPVSKAQYNELISYMIENKIPAGFDSCSAGSFLRSVGGLKGMDVVKKFAFMVEPCESTRMSYYCDVNGSWFPCSFTEGAPGWEKGLKLENDFIKDIWSDPRTQEFRKKCVKNSCGGCMDCPIYEVAPV